MTVHPCTSRGVQPLYHGKADRDATTRQRQYQHVRTVGVHHQLLGQPLSCFNAIAIAHDLLLQVMTPTALAELSWMVRESTEPEDTGEGRLGFHNVTAQVDGCLVVPAPF